MFASAKIRKFYCFGLVLFSFALLGCGKSLGSAVAHCNDKAAQAVVGQVPTNEVARNYIQSQEQGFFFRCMKAEGFKPDDLHKNRMIALIQENNPNVSTERLLFELNEIDRRAMRDPDSGYWMPD